MRSRAVTLALLLLLPWAGGACVPPVSGDPAPLDAPRLTADEARDHLSAELAPECRRLLDAGAIPTGEARVTVEVTQAGEVTRARLAQRTGDRRIDELFARTAGRMRFDADSARPATYTGRLRMGYSCAPGTAIGTIELL